MKNVLRSQEMGNKIFKNKKKKRKNHLTTNKKLNFKKLNGWKKNSK